MPFMSLSHSQDIIELSSPCFVKGESYFILGGSIKLYEEQAISESVKFNTQPLEHHGLRKKSSII